nr:immunoglobulin heavy chain junction region [Mus musculus]MBK4186793.1 immunoglobulin heavy chain junction region [Mus musculus]
CSRGGKLIYFDFW